MKYLPQLQWMSYRRVSLALLTLLVACLMAIGALLYWQIRINAQLTHREGQLARVLEISARATPHRKPPSAALSPVAAHQFDRQVALLNRDWTRLSSLLAPNDREVHLLGMDVDPATGAVRVTGRVDSAMVANTYAQSLSKHVNTLQQVRLLGLERRADGVRFEISAQWID